MNEYWMPFTTTSDLTTERIEKSLDACHAVHVWTSNTLRERFLATLATPTDQEIRLNLTLFIYLEGWKKDAGRYSLNKAAEQTAAEFREQVKIVEGDVVTFPVSRPREKYDELVIQDRKIWLRYLMSYNGISTTYGMLLLDENWRDVLNEQAKELGISSTYLPFLWQSATIKQNKEQHLLRFNFLDPKSAHGKKAKQKMNLGKQDGKEMV